MLQEDNSVEEGKLCADPIRWVFSNPVTIIILYRSDSKKMVNCDCTAKLIEYLQFVVPYYECARVGL